ncbi:hypothetical protein M8J75_005709 [Diaphorina citri]|nr:hypothetical protein M8J75_005709 [Diaphorina citri]KAI5743361.1 hypothetical protein M8J77_017298 [Diaphorina citri]
MNSTGELREKVYSVHKLRKYVRIEYEQTRIKSSRLLVDPQHQPEAAQRGDRCKPKCKALGTRSELQGTRN